jgi:hypothetical protein
MRKRRCVNFYFLTLATAKCPVFRNVTPFSLVKNEIALQTNILPYTEYK